MMMKKWTLPAAAAVLLAIAWWHWPAVAQRATEPVAAAEMITFDQYRNFRTRDLQQRQARLARQLADPSISAAEKTSVERRKAYYDRVAAMPAEERDQLYRERFDQIDTNHDGKLDPEERAAWREKQREFYRQQSADRARPADQQP
jgi:biopolymer transport protein ExbB/TolQ